MDTWWHPVGTRNRIGLRGAHEKSGIHDSAVKRVNSVVEGASAERDVADAREIGRLSGSVCECKLSCI
jgi:hypothetical protein